MIPAHCLKTLTVSNVKLEENGREVKFQNPTKQEHIVVDVDGCCLKNQLAADYLVIVPKVGQLIVELKGTDVRHALKQVVATAKHCVGHKYTQKPIHALVVAKNCPALTTTLQRAQSEMRKVAGGRIRIRSGQVKGQFQDFV